MWFEFSYLGTIFWSINCPTYSLRLTSRILTMRHGCGRFFLNFPIHPDLRPFAGVDIAHIKSRTDEEGWEQDNKVDKVRKSFYIETGIFLSLIHMFYVHKFLNHIRIFYNGTSCGLNLAIWAPYFGLSIVQHTLCALLPGY